MKYRHPLSIHFTCRMGKFLGFPASSPTMADNFDGLVFESFILVIAGVMLVLVFLKYLQKRHDLTKLLLFVFLNYTFAIFFSWLSKWMVVFLLGGPDIPPGYPGAWIIGLILDFRISFIFVLVALLISYVLRVKLFDKEYNKTSKVTSYSIFLVSVAYCAIVYQDGNTLLDVFAFLLVLIYMGFAYFPFMAKAIKAFQSVEKKEFKNAFASLAFMALSFVLIFVFFLIDRLTILFGGTGFTIFYFLAWTFAIIGIIAAYLGYIKPRK